MSKRLKKLRQEQEVLKRAINYCHDKCQREKLFDKLGIVNKEIERLTFKIKLFEEMNKNELRN